MAKVLIKRGTRAQLDAAASANGLAIGELYLITDEDSLAVGTDIGAYVVTLPASSGTQYPLLAGRASGQTLTGGTGASDALTLKGTSGDGTATAAALLVNVGNNGNLEALKIANNGQFTIKGDASLDSPIFGAELLATAGWTATAGWAESPEDTFAHTSGTTTLSHSATVLASTRYQFSWTVTGRTTGSFTITLRDQILATTATGTWGPVTTAAGSGGLTITPTTDFNGTISLMSLKIVAQVSSPRRVVLDSAGVVLFEERASATNTFFGVGAGGYTTTGINDTGHGVGALYFNTTGSNNAAQGQWALYSNTTGSNNSAHGAGSMLLNLSGSANSAHGNNALYNNTTGSSNSAQGRQALYANTTGSLNVASGANAARYHADGVTALTNPENSIYIGANCRGKDNDDDNSIVIGFGAIGLGANTTVLGNVNTTTTVAFGDVGLGVEAPAAKVHAVETTEQLRLGYDAANYASFTVAADGKLAIGSTGGTIYTPDAIENTTAGAGITLRSPDGTPYAITVADGGAFAGVAPASHAHAAGDITSGTMATARLGSGTADATTYLRGDQTWAAVSGGGTWDGDIADIDLDGGTDIGADLADVDLILVDDGAGGVNRKATLSRIAAYIASKDVETILIAVTNQVSPLTFGANKVKFRMPWAMTAVAVRGAVTTAPTGATVIVDINQAGTSILSTRLSIDIGELTSTTAADAAVLSTTSLTDDAEMSIDIDQVGSTVAGVGLTVTLIGRRT